MSKHVLDHERTTTGQRAERYAEVERKRAPEGSSPAAKAAHQRAQTREGTRTEQFVRIAKGETA